MGIEYEIKDFQIDVIARSHDIPVVVDFWADWCGPCKILGPVMERLAEKSKDGWVLAKVDTDKHQEVAATYGIRSIPAVKLFVDGKITHEFVGALPEAQIVRWLEKALPSKLRKDIEHATRLLAGDEHVKAQWVLENVLRQEPANEQALVLLAKTYLHISPDKAVELVKDIEEHSAQFPTVAMIRSFAGLMKHLRTPDSLPEDAVKPLYLEAIRLLSSGNYDGALERFIEVLRANRNYDDDGSRKACIAIFRILGDEHETTQKHRRSFSGALYA